MIHTHTHTHHRERERERESLLTRGMEIDMCVLRATHPPLLIFRLKDERSRHDPILYTPNLKDGYYYSLLYRKN